MGPFEIPSVVRSAHANRISSPTAIRHHREHGEHSIAEAPPP